MKRRLATLLSIYLFGSSFVLTRVQAQVVTASFAPDSIADNPAAVATRQWGIVGAFYSYAESEAEAQYGASSSQKSFLRTTLINHNELIFSGRKTFLVPELYFDYSKGSRKDRFAQSEPEFSHAILCGQFNLGFDLAKFFKTGIQFLNLRSNTNYAQTYDDTNFKSESESKYDTEIVGFGGGTTFNLGEHLSFGYHILSVANRFSYEYKQKLTGQQDASGSGSGETFAVKQGMGLSLQAGDAKQSAIRNEMSYSQMSPLENAGLQNKIGEQYSVSLETIWWKFLGGVAVRATKGMYLNFRRYMEFLLEDFSNEETQLSYSAFAGFRTEKGHSFGFKAYVYSGDSKININRQVISSTVKGSSFGVSYAYVF